MLPSNVNDGGDSVSATDLEQSIRERQQEALDKKEAGSPNPARVCVREALRACVRVCMYVCMCVCVV